MSDDNSGDGFALIIIGLFFLSLFLAMLRIRELELRVEQLQATTQPSVEVER